MLRCLLPCLKDWAWGSLPHVLCPDYPGTDPANKLRLAHFRLRFVTRQKWHEQGCDTREVVFVSSLALASTARIDRVHRSLGQARQDPFQAYFDRRGAVGLSLVRRDICHLNQIPFVISNAPRTVYGQGCTCSTRA